MSDRQYSAYLISLSVAIIALVWWFCASHGATHLQGLTLGANVATLVMLGHCLYNLTRIGR